jgi:general stress protein YciG
MAGRSQRGFASMNAEKQREIARIGGRKAHERGTAHQFTHQEAVAAGRLGGEAVSRNRQHMAEIGRRGGKALRQRQPTPTAETRDSMAGDTPPVPSGQTHPAGLVIHSDDFQE